MRYLVIHVDNYAIVHYTICEGSSASDILKDWGCFNNTYIKKIFKLGVLVYESNNIKEV